MEAVDLSGGQPHAFMIPLVAGKASAARAMADEVRSTRNSAYRESRRQAGILREVVFLQTSAYGEALVVFWLSKNPTASFELLTQSNQPFDAWLTSSALSLHATPDADALLAAKQNRVIAQYPH